MIQGYPDQTSVNPGEQIDFHVSTDAVQFRMDFYRQGKTLEFKLSTEWMCGAFADAHDHDQDWGTAAIRADGKQVTGWPQYTCVVPSSWASGVYIVMFIEGDGRGHPSSTQQPPLDRSTSDARLGKAMFVVKNPLPALSSSMLYKVPLFTYQMYNMGFYNGIDGKFVAASGYGRLDPESGIWVGQSLTVSLRRPGGGTGGTPWDSAEAGVWPAIGAHGNPDPLDTSSPRQTFAHWDAKMISWLEANRYRVDYCTDLDIHLDGKLELLGRYSLVLSVGHDEYYSTRMRDNLEAYVAAGGNIAFFSGNTAYWRVVFPIVGIDKRRILIFIRRNSKWADVARANRPEDALTGVGFRNGGERDYPKPQNEDESVGYTVQHTDRWPFENTGLRDGDEFGREVCLVGYECDGTPYDGNSPPLVSPRFNPSDLTPVGLTILGVGSTAKWGAAGAATMAMYTKNGTVFTGATTDWSRVVAKGHDVTVQITKNVIGRLGGSPSTDIVLANLREIIACDGFSSPEGDKRCVIVATSDGKILDLGSHRSDKRGLMLISKVPGLLDIGAFYSNDGGTCHIWAAAKDGNLWELLFTSPAGIQRKLLGSFPGASRITAFSADNGYRCGIIALSGGRVFAVSYDRDSNQRAIDLGTFTGLVDVGGYYSSDNNCCHAIVATADGDVYEISFDREAPPKKTILGVFAGVTRVSGFYVPTDALFSRRVIVATGYGKACQIKIGPKGEVIRTLILDGTFVVDIGGFYCDDDQGRYVIFATASGAVCEKFYDRRD